MSASLVGSEMCIRDSGTTGHSTAPRDIACHRTPTHAMAPHSTAPHGSEPVSYTHLTLPTICSV
eukprot:5742059-Alexandrium_andersonii.AAC.1